MPALTISTDNANPSISRSSSPNRPPISPITPPLAATTFPPNTAPPRQTFTHEQPDQTAAPIPPPQPISFDANPDVIALRSAISVLQVQRRRATEDIQTLSAAMDEAVTEPEAFTKDLMAGQVHPRGSAANEEEDDDDDEDENDNQPPAHPKEKPQSRKWASLPTPQNVIRTPPINWSQYAVMGESLDKLHAEQQSRPSQGVPAVYRPDGTYEFRSGGTQETYPGVMAPYAPSKDKLEKPRGKK